MSGLEKLRVIRPQGHSRRLLAAYLQLVDRERRLAQAIGLERRARRVVFVDAGRTGMVRRPWPRPATATLPTLSPGRARSGRRRKDSSISKGAADHERTGIGNSHRP
jgi:hypothetical protein